MVIFLNIKFYYLYITEDIFSKDFKPDNDLLCYTLRQSTIGAEELDS